MRTSLLKLLPFLASVTVGTGLFGLEEFFISHQGISTLIIGIASALFGIPIIFIFYSMTTSFSKRHIKRIITRHIVFEMNYPIIRLLKDLAVILDFKYKLSRDNFHNFLAENEEIIEKTPKFRRDTPKEFQKYKDNILRIMYNIDQMDILPEDIIQTLLSIAEELGVIALELQEKKKRMKIIRLSLQTLINAMDKWIKFCEREAITNHHSFTLER